jgi:hypothetical protein
MKNIQEEVQKIHAQFGTSEMANYKIQLLFEEHCKIDLENIEKLASKLFAEMPSEISTSTAKKKAIELVKLLTQSNS